MRLFSFLMNVVIRVAIKSLCFMKRRIWNMDYKFYILGSNCMGYLPSIGRYQQFETEDEYIRYFRENEREDPV